MRQLLPLALLHQTRDVHQQHLFLCTRHRPALFDTPVQSTTCSSSNHSEQKRASKKARNKLSECLEGVGRTALLEEQLGARDGGLGVRGRARVCGELADGGLRDVGAGLGGRGRVEREHEARGRAVGHAVLRVGVERGPLRRAERVRGREQLPRLGAERVAAQRGLPAAHGLGAPLERAVRLAADEPQRAGDDGGAVRARVGRLLEQREALGGPAECVEAHGREQQRLGGGVPVREKTRLAQEPHRALVLAVGRQAARVQQHVLVIL